MLTDSFAVFILTHGRAERVTTYSALRKQGYTGKIYLLIDDTDKQENLYKKLYGDQVIVFNKEKAIDYTDSADNLTRTNSVVYARNWNFVVAQELGISYFLQLDDDYPRFSNIFNNSRQYITSQRRLKNLDKVFLAMTQFLIDSQAHSIAMSQGGDFIGGHGSNVAKLESAGLFSRKAMNAFFMNTAKPFKFMGRINEDVNAYIHLGSRGYLFVTVPRIRLEQVQTQANEGGLTDIYKDLGTYVKSFYSVLYSPSSVSIREMGFKNKRLHHRVNWKSAVPLIVDPSFKKYTV